MLQEISPLEGARGLTGFKVLASPGKVRVIRHSPLKQKFGGDRAEEKAEYEDARLSALILLLGRWLENADALGIIRNVLLTERYRLVRHGGKWHKEAIFDEKYTEIGSLRSLDERWDHGMLIGDFVASEVSWLRDDLIDRQKERRSTDPPTSTLPEWEGDSYIGSGSSSPLDRPGEFPTTSQKKRPGFTARARETLESAGVVSEIEWGKNAVLVTCTLPGSSPDAYKLLADFSGKIMSRLWDRVAVHCKRKLNRPARLGWFYVWEKQKRGALHLHACLAASPEDFKAEELKLIGKLITDWWFEILRDIGDKNGVNMFLNIEKDIDWSDSPDKWQSDVQVIKKSIARYLSKYASKNAASERGATFDGDKDGFPTPKRWWGRNQVISKLIKKWSWELAIECANPLDIPLNEIVQESLQVYQGGCHTDCHTDCHTGLYNGIDKARTDFWEVVKETKIYTGEKNIKVNKSICNGITSTYLYSPQNYTEVFSQVSEMASVITELAESSGERMTPYDERKPIERESVNQTPKPLLKWDKDLLRGVDPTNGKIWDIERYTWFDIWQSAQDPLYWNGWMKQEIEAANLSNELYILQLTMMQQGVTKQNEYEFFFGNKDPGREIDIWQEVAAQTAIHEAEIRYLAETGPQSVQTEKVATNRHTLSGVR